MLNECVRCTFLGMTMPSPARTILVSGAGIAGPVLAFWLRRYGFEPTVVEVAPGLRPGGQTIDLRGAGRAVVERMGLMPEARRLALDQRGIAYVGSDGRHLAEITVADFDGEGIVSEIEILRGDLAQLFHDATTDIEYLFSTRVTALVEDANGVEVTLETTGPHDASIAGPAPATTVRRFDLVVGADGPHSATRRLAFGPESSFVTPVGGYTAWFTAPDLIGLDHWFLMYNEPPGVVVSMRPDSVPGSAKAGLSFVSPLLDYDRHDFDAQRHLLAEHLAGVGWRAAELVAAAQTAEDFYFDAITQVHLDSWSSGRVVLVGDAGYCPSPLTGMGTSLAMVGAYVLAGELAAARREHVQAFARYEERLRPYVRQGQRLPPGGITGFAPATAFSIRMRTLGTRLMVRWPFRPMAKRLLFSSAEAITLPDYEPHLDRRRDRGAARVGEPL